MPTDLEKIKSLARQRRYSDALALCEALAQSATIPVIDTLRARAYVLGLSGNYELALKDRELILTDDVAKLRDYYLAANCALNSKRLSAPRHCLRLCCRKKRVKAAPGFDRVGTSCLHTLR